MASAGGKKKTKWKAVDPAIITNTTTRKTSSWADESENDFGDSHDYGRKAAPAVVLPTAPRAARGPEMEASIPKEPPYQAYLSNLSYEVTEDDLAEFFADMKVKSVRLPKDDRGNSGRTKGFGYVEFEDRNSLIEALSMPVTMCKSRRMRIEVAEGDGRGGRSGGRDRGYGGFGGFGGDPDRSTGDWRSGPRTDAADPPDRDGYRSGGMRREYGTDRGRGGSGYRDDDRGGFRRDGMRDGDGFRDRGFRDGGSEDRGSGTWRRDPEPRDSAPDDRDRAAGGWRRDQESRDHAPSFDRGERRFFDDRGERRGFEDRGERRGFEDRGERRGFEDRGERRGFEDRGGGGGGGGGGWRRDPEPRDSDPPPDRGEPKQRQRLNLQPRTKSEAAPAPAAPAPSAPSIFGGARPVDTAAREREIEERLSKRRDPAVAASVAAPSERSKTESAGGGESAPAADSDSAPVIEPAPAPSDNVWARRSQQTNSTEVR